MVKFTFIYPRLFSTLLLPAHLVSRTVFFSAVGRSLRAEGTCAAADPMKAAPGVPPPQRLALISLLLLAAAPVSGIV